ncbi:Uncharacterized protein YPO0396 [Arenibacter nanhaiticus]|uniref:Uncharacterized protein YPO0396 n=1 Tax=Arenibacter nanhaiticus TaxID=558155 RepID=A0A1M6KIL5_9FLAO|nr:SbcC/MukB-like Walker B domain-containing protein [Arenibacter nanhaiticus]SHJ58720.1 Uncharacterized protein YPO0396 [Arenibacter nanhaiticus]
MLSLFSTNSNTAGFRLQYMEVLNWGTFHDRIFRIHPKGNNSLLTGANASGKSTFIDALLTLMVPAKKDRFYNQSSGVDKKGDRTEETYVCGNYGSIQKEGELSSTLQMLRDKNSAYSIILASFSNTEDKHITIFQLRWFSNGNLKRAYGMAHAPLEIAVDFAEFDDKFAWKRRLEKIYNTNKPRKIVEFFEGPTTYAQRIADLFGMRSVKALSLFNQVVGVKVLEDLDEFIRTNMLEELDAESRFMHLKESFLTLMDAKVNIEKAREQIAQLQPIDQFATDLQSIQTSLKKLQHEKEVGVYWFAKKNVDLSEIALEKCQENLKALEEALQGLKRQEAELKIRETNLMVQIKSDQVGNQIEQLKTEIEKLIFTRDQKKRKLSLYNELVASLGLNLDPGPESYKDNRDKANVGKETLEKEELESSEKLRLAKNGVDLVKEKITAANTTIEELRKNNNNISGRVAEIRDEILAHIGASKDELPFIGELIKVKEEESIWEHATEKLLHNFALRLIVPEKYYSRVNAYVNKTDLKGRITYQRYRGFTSLASLDQGKEASNELIHKLEFKADSQYSEWLADIISKQYNYACVENLEVFETFEEKAITPEGLIKFAKGKHEKDDRIHISRRANFVLGWDNKEKIKHLLADIKILQEKEITINKEIERLSLELNGLKQRRDSYIKLLDVFTDYEDIHWQALAVSIQEKEDQKLALEKANDKVKELQRQLDEVQQKLKVISESEIETNNRARFKQEAKIEEIDKERKGSFQIINHLGEVNTHDFENQYPELCEVTLDDIKKVEVRFQKNTSEAINKLEQEKTSKEYNLRLKINAFKRPSEEITEKFKDWRSDVSELPDASNLEFVREYQIYLKQLVDDNLPKFERKFDQYLQETITNKIGDFRMFFEGWSDEIKSSIQHLNDSLRGINFKSNPATYIQMVVPHKISEDVKVFRSLLNAAIPNTREIEASVDGRKNHFFNHIEPLIEKLSVEEWRKKVTDVRSWFSYKAEEFYKETGEKAKTYESMGQLSGGEKAQLTYTILGSAIAYQFGLTKEGLQPNSFRFIAIDEAFKAQDEDKSRYLINLCKQLHLQLLVVTPSDNIHIVENDISFVHYVERKEDKYSWLYNMPIEQFREQKALLVD